MGAHEAKVDIPIEEIMRKYAAYADEIVDAIGKELLEEAKAWAYFSFENKTGKLRKKFRRKTSKFDTDAQIVGAFAPHAHLVEFGTKVRVDRRGKVSGHMPAKPFLGPAEDAVRSRLEQIVKSVTCPITEVK